MHHLPCGVCLAVGTELNASVRCESRALVEWCHRITGYTQPRVWWVQYFGKQPDEVEGGYTGLHQDWTSWSQEINGTADRTPILPSSLSSSRTPSLELGVLDDFGNAGIADPNGFSGSGLFTCWVALSEVGSDSAPLQFVKGSHRWGVKYQDKATHRQDRQTQQREHAITHIALHTWCESRFMLHSMCR